MEISLKYLKMLRFAVHKHIGELKEEDNPPIPEDQHNAEIREFEELENMIEQLILKE